MGSWWAREAMSELPQALRRAAIQWRSVSGDGFAQVQQQRRDLRPGGVFGHGDSFVARRFAVGEVFFGGRFVGGVAGAFAVECVGEDGEFGVRRRARDAFFERPAEAADLVGGLFEDALGEGARGFDELHVVEQHERLQRRGGCRPRQTVQVSRLGASKATMLGGGTVRFQYV